MPKYSVIISAYNVEKYINQAIDSVLNQKTDNIELLVFDDCSTDNTANIINAYDDPKIHKYLSFKNVGPGAGRNRMLSKATGEYIMFLDGDDYFEPNVIETLEKYNNHNQYDLVVFNYNRVYPDGQCVKSNVGKRANTIYTGAWNKLYRAEVAKGGRFEESIYFEDVRYALETFNLAKNVGLVDQALVGYRQKRVNQITGGTDAKRHLDIVPATKKLVSDIERDRITNGDILEELNSQFFTHAFLALMAKDQDSKKVMDSIIQAQKSLNGWNGKYSDNKMINLKDKMLMLLMSGHQYKLAQMLGDALLNN